MRGLFNMIALISTAIVMFYIGKGCAPECEVIKVFEVDSTLLKQKQVVIDSLKEEGRELEVIIVRQQDSLNKVLSDMSKIKSKSEYTLAMYRRNRATMNVPAQLTNCDSIVNEYAMYREACETFVQETDSLVSVMYVQSTNKDKIIAQQDETINDINMAYINSAANQKLYYDQANKNIKKKRTWQKVSAVLAGFLAVSLMAR